MTELVAARLRRALLEVVAEIMPWLAAEDVTDDKSLRDLGADSVERVEIITLLLHRVNSDEPVTSFADMPDIGGLIERLAKGADR